MVLGVGFMELYLMISTTLLVTIALFFSKQIRQYFIYILVIVSLYSLLAYIVDTDFFKGINEGYLGLSFFIIVMFAGAFPKQSILSKRLRSVRKEYSIIGFVTLLPHSVIFLLYYVKRFLVVEWFGIVAMAIMLPLFIISFSKIKKKMNIKRWIQIQKLSYLVYAAIYLHLMLVGQSSHLLAYTIIFSLYSALKLWKSVKEGSKDKVVVSVTFATMILFTLILIQPLFIFDRVDSVPSLDTGVIVDDETTSEDNEVIIDEIDSFLYTDGVYEGEANGFQNMPVKVTVTVVDGVISEITILAYGSTSRGPMNYESIADALRDEIIDTQSLTVDAVSGASYTSNGLIDAVKDALNID